ncbi:MAG: hypothetical protein HQL56_15085 [Magnetococcales bacterium]|nr:hypothetical protein [Magnetococcales bacterium]
MKVFAGRFLEPCSKNSVENCAWNWQPNNQEIQKIYGSGANTNTRESTYAAERDDRSDQDRPNEGMLAA